MFLGLQYEKIPEPIHKYGLSDEDPFHVRQFNSNLYSLRKTPTQNQQYFRLDGPRH